MLATTVSSIISNKLTLKKIHNAYFFRSENLVGVVGVSISTEEEYLPMFPKQMNMITFESVISH